MTRLVQSSLILVIFLAGVPSPLAADALGPPVPTVIAFAGEGINPYHEAFREPSWTAHPSTYIPGYPQDAKPFPITLDAGTFEEAWAADLHLWESIEPMQLYYIPGTRVVGAISVVDSQNQTSWPYFYEDGETSHTTQAIDAGSGRFSGTAPKSAIVVASGTGAAFEMRWIADQEWIDLSSLSLGCWGGLGVPPGIKSSVEVLGWEPDLPGIAEATYLMTQRGKLFFNGAGNGVGINPACDTMGPPWVMTVGAITGNGTAQFPYFQSTTQWRPAEVSAHNQGAFAIKDTFSDVRYVSGTSFSGPRLAGYAARLIEDARARLGDDQGFHDGAFAHSAPGVALPSDGPLTDGVLNRTELEDLLRRNAQDYPMQEETLWGVPITPESYYLFKGYGGFMEPAYEQARAVLLGELPMPQRPTEDKWHTRFDAAVGAYWEPLACRAHSTDREPSACWTEPIPRHADALLGTV